MGCIHVQKFCAETFDVDFRWIQPSEVQSVSLERE